MARRAREGFPWHARIVRASDYRAVYAAGRKLNSQNFVLFGLENKLGHHRLGITVSGKVGGAVARNRVKRHFREIFRKSSCQIPHHFDLVVNAKRGSVAASYDALREEFMSVARRICV